MTQNGSSQTAMGIHIFCEALKNVIWINIHMLYAICHMPDGASTEIREKIVILSVNEGEYREIIIIIGPASIRIAYTKISYLFINECINKFNIFICTDIEIYCMRILLYPIFIFVWNWIAFFYFDIYKHFTCIRHMKCFAQFKHLKNHNIRFCRSISENVIAT